MLYPVLAPRLPGHSKWIRSSLTVSTFRCPSTRTHWHCSHRDTSWMPSNPCCYNVMSTWSLHSILGIGRVCKKSNIGVIRDVFCSALNFNSPPCDTDTRTKHLEACINIPDHHQIRHQQSTIDVIRRKDPVILQNRMGQIREQVQSEWSPASKDLAWGRIQLQ